MQALIWNDAPYIWLQINENVSAARKPVSGFPDAVTHLLHQQRAMHEHDNQPYHRLRDSAVVTQRPLWAADDASVAGRGDVGFVSAAAALRVGGKRRSAVRAIFCPHT